MTIRFAVAFASSLLILSACAQNDAVKAASAAQLTAVGQTYGAAMPASPQPQPLSNAMKKVDDFIGKPAKFSGRVGRVCQAKGCWMMLTDGAASVRVKFGDEAFFIPKDASGDAVVFGTLELITVNPAHAKHMAQDAGDASANTASAPTKEYRVMATSVVLAAN